MLGHIGSEKHLFDFRVCPSRLERMFFSSPCTACDSAHIIHLSKHRLGFTHSGNVRYESVARRNFTACWFSIGLSLRMSKYVLVKSKYYVQHILTVLLLSAVRLRCVNLRNITCYSPVTLLMIYFFDIANARTSGHSLPRIVV